MTWVALVQSPVDRRTKDSASSLVIVFSLGSSPGRSRLQESVPLELSICSVVLPQASKEVPAQRGWQVGSCFQDKQR